jgi:hypothetical protein
MCLANSVVPVSVTTSATATGTQKAQTPSITYNAGNNMKQTSASSSNKKQKLIICQHTANCIKNYQHSE